MSNFVDLFNEDMQYINESKIKDLFSNITKKYKNLKISMSKEQRDFDRKVKNKEIIKRNGKYYEEDWFCNIQDYTPGMTEDEFKKKSTKEFNEFTKALKDSGKFKDCEFFIAGYDYIENKMYPEQSHWFLVINSYKEVKDPRSKNESYSNFTDLDLFNEDCDTCEDSIVSKINATYEVNKQKRKDLENKVKDKYNSLRKETRAKAKENAFKTEVSQFQFGPYFEENYSNSILNESLFIDNDFKDKVKEYNSVNKYRTSKKLYKSEYEVITSIEKSLGLKIEGKMYRTGMGPVGVESIISYETKMKSKDSIYRVSFQITPTVDRQFRDPKIVLIKPTRR